MQEQRHFSSFFYQQSALSETLQIHLINVIWHKNKIIQTMPNEISRW